MPNSSSSSVVRACSSLEFKIPGFSYHFSILKNNGHNCLRKSRKACMIYKHRIMGTEFLSMHDLYIYKGLFVMAG